MKETEIVSSNKSDSGQSVRRKTVAGAIGIAVIAAGAASVWFFASRPPLNADRTTVPAPPAIDGKVTLTILYPFDETLFPPEIAAPTFAWQSSPAGLAAWQIAFAFQDGKEDLVFSTSDTEWVPTDEDWGWIKERSVVKPATVRIRGFRDASSPEAACEARIRISTAADEVGAPLFFREVNVPFRVAVKDPAAHIRWRFGPVSSKGPPPIVMEKLPVCGNCHSFSADGRMLAMEVDSGNDKASYAIAPVEKKIVLEPENIITWADFRREDNQKTFGLLCQASPDGRHVVGTVKDRALAVYRDELAFSQLFFLVKGVMAIYDRQKDSIHLLPGADDPDHVQTNGTWSPDGKTIVFARSHDKAYDPPSLREIDSVLVPQAEAREFLDGGRTFCYDLYRIPFNEGKGGKAEPIPGASNNGMSNYFAKFSSDGKWIVFCKARSFMLLQPDSELYIIPAEGGEARRLRCNTGRMNSWHSWSPNGRWLVFSSKAFSDYTQLFLTHIDEEGNSTPAVQLKNFTVENRAANIPEFVNAAPDAIAEIREHFLDDTNYLRAGDEFQRQGEYQNAINRYHRAIDINPDNPLVYTNWGSCLLSLGRVEEAKERLLKAIELKPDLAIAHCNLGIVLLQQSQPAEAAAAHREAIRLDPDYAPARLHLGTLLLGQGQLEEAIVQLKEAARIAPYDPFGQFNLAMALIAARNPQPAAEHLELALAREPKFVPAMISLAVLRATSDDPALRRGQQAVELAERARSLVPPENPEVLHALAAAYAEVGRFEEAVATAQLAASTARNSGNAALAAAIEQALGMYSQRQPLRASF